MNLISSQFRRCPLLLLAALMCAHPSIARADISVGTTSQIATGFDGQPANDFSTGVSFGANGKQVVFESNASNLVSDDTNGFHDVFVKDLKTRVITRVSRGNNSSAGVPGAQTNADSFLGAVSALGPDGFSAVAFATFADNLPGNALGNDFSKVYVRLPGIGATAFVFPKIGAPTGNGTSTTPSIAAIPLTDGRNKVLVAYITDFALDPNDTNGLFDVYLAEAIAPQRLVQNDPTQGRFTRISKSKTNGIETSTDSDFPKISADGRFVVFVSAAPELVPIVAASVPRQIYRYDIAKQETQLISVGSDGNPGNADSLSPAISFNGRYITYCTDATNIISNTPINSRTVIWKDVDTGDTVQVNATQAGVSSANGRADATAISPNGRLVAFSDTAPDLVSGDNNDSRDIFVKDVITKEIVRASVGPGGIEADGSSSRPSIAGDSFTGLSYAVAYESTATNLVSGVAGNPSGDIYLTPLTITAPPITANVPIAVPPDVKVNSKTITFTAQEFGISGSSAVLGSPVAQDEATSSVQLRYEFEMTRTTSSGGKKRTSRSSLLSKRNTLTVVRRKGTYEVRNRVLKIRVTKGKPNKTLTKTGFSPRQRFTLK